MNNWHECTVKYDKTNEQGELVEVKEKYLVEALSFTDAETRMNKEIEPFISGDFSVESVMKRKIADVVISQNENADRWYKAKLIFVSYDEGKEKRTLHNMYVKASSFNFSLDVLTDHMRGIMVAWHIDSISETKILDVYSFENA